MDLAVGERIIVLVDMDCFYVQVEQKLCPEFDNIPCIVTQYNSFNGGGIIAVNYEARACGVTRGMRGDQAQRLCPTLHNFRVPEVREKADLTRYREAGAEVIGVLCQFCDCVERASVDEAYLDLTLEVERRYDDAKSMVKPEKLLNTFVVGWDKEAKGDDVRSWLENVFEEDHLVADQKLALAAVIVEEMREAVYLKTRFRCSAGIAHNKVLAKLACGLHKPNRQTVLPHASVPILYKTLSIKKVRNLGGKFGDEVKNKLGIETMLELAAFSESQLVSYFGQKNGSWLYSIAKGIDHEPVTARQLPKSIGCGKNFPGKQCLDSKKKVKHWLDQLSIELAERLQRDQSCNKRVARSLVVSVGSKGDDNQTTSLSRTCTIHLYDSQKIANDAFQAIQKLNTASAASLLWRPVIISLSIAAGKFEDSLDSSISNIQSYFAPSKSLPKLSGDISNVSLTDDEVKKQNIEETQEVTPANRGNGKVERNSLSGKSKLPNGIHSYFEKKTEGDCIGIEKLEGDKKMVEAVESNDELDLKEPSLQFDMQEVPVSDSVHSVDSPAPEVAVSVSVGSPAPEAAVSVSVDCPAPEAAVSVSVDSPAPEAAVSVSVDSPAPKSFFARKFLERKNINKASAGSSSSVHEGDETVPPHLESSTSASPLNSGGSDAFEQDETLQIVPCRKSFFTKPGTSKRDCELSPEISFVCDKCKKRIPCWEETEHADFHFALDVQKTMRTIPVPNATSVVVTKQKTATKRASKNSKTLQTQKKRIKQQVNTLDAFFR